jgi:hypothetical protein
VDVDDDAILIEGDARLLRVDVAGGFRVSAQIVAAIGTIEELRLEGALKRLGRDVDLCGVRGDDEDREQKSAEGQGSPALGFRIIGLETPRGHQTGCPTVAKLRWGCRMRSA